MRTTEQILALWRQRVAERSDAAAAMQQVRDIVNGDAELPSDELSEESKPAVADLISIGGEQMAMRVASVMPDLDLPPLNPTSRPSTKRAADARRAVLGWWDANDMEALAYKRALHLLFDGETPVLLEPDFTTRMPKWEAMDPMAAYPPPVTGLSPLVDDCLFTFAKTFEWLKSEYPAHAAAMPRTARTPDATVLLLKYVDQEDCVLVAVGENLDKPYMLHQPPGQTAAYRAPGGLAGSTSWTAGTYWTTDIEYAELNRYPHGLGLCPVAYPSRVTYDKHMGAFNKLVNLLYLQARLMALAVIGVDRGILKETWVENTVQGSPARIIQQADARSGKVGEIVDGKLVQFGPDPGFMTMPMLDRLEYAIRQSGGISPELGGASQANVRTGRRGENILSAALDFPIARAQLTLARSMTVEVQIAIAIAKRWWGDRELVYDVDWPGERGPVVYRPNKVFEQRRAIVSFAQAGADASQLIIGAGQRIGLKTLSRRSFMKMDQWTPDAEAEHDAVIAEGLEDALMASIQQQAAAGAIPPTDVARIMELVRTDRMELAEAIAQTQREAQERQATEAPAGSPETQPGIAQPGMGAEQPVAATQGPTSDQANIVQMLRGLRGAQMTSPAERRATPIGA